MNEEKEEEKKTDKGKLFAYFSPSNPDMNFSSFKKPQGSLIKEDIEESSGEEDNPKKEESKAITPKKSKTKDPSIVEVQNSLTFKQFYDSVTKGEQQYK